MGAISVELFLTFFIFSTILPLEQLENKLRGTTMLKKQFFSNVLPAMLAFTFSGIYAIIDGWFIGQSVGDLGLAAINIAYPIPALIQAIGTGIGMAGGIQLGIYIGKGDKEKQKDFMGNTMLLLGIACILITISMSLTYPTLLHMFGAEGELFDLACDYAKIITCFSVFQILSTGLLPIIRNYDGAVVAMISMTAGFFTNGFLDWLLVVKLSYGMTGAALATIIGQSVTTFPCIFFLIAKGKLFHFARLKPIGSVIKEILTVAVSPFGLTLSPNIAILALNKGAITYGGNNAAASYAIISYVVYVVQLLLQGIGDGCQPLLSKFYGLQRNDYVKEIRKMAYIFAVGIAVVSIILIITLRQPIPYFFGASKEVAGPTSDTLIIFASGLIFFAFLRITTSYFYATGKNKFAYILIYGEPLLLATLILLVLPKFFGLTGVWIAVPITQFCIMILSFILLRKGSSN